MMKKILLFISLVSLLFIVYCKNNAKDQDQDQEDQNTEDVSYDDEETEDCEVYICTGDDAYAYHSEEVCKGLDNCINDVICISEEDAENRGYNPCKICYGFNVDDDINYHNNDLYNTDSNINNSDNNSDLNDNENNNSDLYQF